MAMITLAMGRDKHASVDSLSRVTCRRVVGLVDHKMRMNSELCANVRVSFIMPRSYLCPCEAHVWVPEPKVTQAVAKSRCLVELLRPATEVEEEFGRVNKAMSREIVFCPVKIGRARRQSM